MQLSRRGGLIAVATLAVSVLAAVDPAYAAETHGIDGATLILNEAGFTAESMAASGDIEDGAIGRFGGRHRRIAHAARDDPREHPCFGAMIAKPGCSVASVGEGQHTLVQADDRIPKPPVLSDKDADIL